jgi:hypothetical protein
MPTERSMKRYLLLMASRRVVSDDKLLANLLQLNTERYAAEQAQALLNRKPPTAESGTPARKIPTSVRLSRRHEMK